MSAFNKSFIVVITSGIVNQYLISNPSLPHSPSVLTWSPTSSLFYVGTTAGTVYIVHVKEPKGGGVGGGGWSLELNKESVR